MRDLVIEVLIALDKGAVAPTLPDGENVRFVESMSFGQAAALNAGAAAATADYLAFLEDDDQWHPERVAYGLRALENADFTSTNQLEMDENGTVVRINDFPTPSGWLMPASSWLRVGNFDESFRWHLDNEWLGRLAESGLRRVHLVEAIAPVQPDAIAQARPLLLYCLRNGGPRVELGRHALPMPLIDRLVHSSSGMATIARDPKETQASKEEFRRIFDRFGRIPC